MCIAGYCLAVSFKGFCVAAIYCIQWHPVPDWDGTRDEAIVIWVIFGIHLYVTFFMVAFVISSRGLRRVAEGSQCGHL